MLGDEGHCPCRENRRWRCLEINSQRSATTSSSVHGDATCNSRIIRGASHKPQVARESRGNRAGVALPRVPPPGKICPFGWSRADETIAGHSGRCALGGGDQRGGFLSRICVRGYSAAHRLLGDQCGHRAGTSRAGQKIYAGYALARPDLVRQVVDFARTAGVKAAYQKVQSRLDMLARCARIRSLAIEEAIGSGESISLHSAHAPAIPSTADEL